jgi:hypothetical protein
MDMNAYTDRDMDRHSHRRRHENGQEQGHFNIPEIKLKCCKVFFIWHGKCANKENVDNHACILLRIKNTLRIQKKVTAVLRPLQA